MRNRVLADPRFQRRSARLPGVSQTARKWSRQLFDQVAGFVYSQVLLAVVESELLAMLAGGPIDEEDLPARLGLSLAATARLLRAAEALDLADEVEPRRWMLGPQGAILNANPPVQAMIRHHRLLYRDLEDPIALLRADRDEETNLSRFWHYREDAVPEAARAYSELMAATQAIVAEQVLSVYDFGRHEALLDIGGGHGAFAGAVAEKYPALRVGVLDLPPVIAGLAKSESLATDRIERHAGDFFHSLPGGRFDCMSLVRILHDHDDERALALLRTIASSLPSDGRLVVAEPLAKTPGAKAMGGAYFGFYLWAMGSGKPRSLAEISTLLKRAGFANVSAKPTSQPIIASVIVASL